MSEPTLLPAERIALTVALAQLKRGEHPEQNVTAMCVLALARLDGREDWTDTGHPAHDDTNEGA